MVDDPQLFGLRPEFVEAAALDGPTEKVQVLDAATADVAVELAVAHLLLLHDDAVNAPAVCHFGKLNLLVFVVRIRFVLVLAKSIRNEVLHS